MVPPRLSTDACEVALSVGTSAHGSHLRVLLDPTKQVRWQPCTAFPVLHEHVCVNLNGTSGIWFQRCTQVVLFDFRRRLGCTITRISGPTFLILYMRLRRSYSNFCSVMGGTSSTTKFAAVSSCSGAFTCVNISLSR